MLKIANAKGTGYPVERPVRERKGLGIGHLQANAVVHALVGGFCHERSHHAFGNIHAHNARAASGGFGNGNGAVSRAAGYIQDALRGAIDNLLEGTLPPQPVHVHGHQVVEPVIRRRNPVEHLLYVFFFGHYGTGS